MPNHQVIQVSYGEVRLVTDTKELREQKFSLKRLSEVTVALWTIILRTVLISSVLAVLTVTISEVMRDTVVVEEIGLPNSLMEMGYSGTVATHRLWDSTQWINDNAGTTKDRASLIADSRQLEITEPGTGLSLSGLAQVIRRLIGREQPRIAGEFVCRDADCTIEHLELRLRIFLNGSMKVTRVGQLGELETEAAISAYFDQAALALLKVIDPYVRASFLYAVETDELPANMMDRAEALVGRLGPFPPGADNPRSIFEARAIIRQKHPQRAWAAVLLADHEYREGNLEAGLDWIAQSITLANADRVPPFPNAHSIWGNVLRDLERYEEAIEKYDAALQIDREYTSAYNGWGNALSDLGRYEEAIEKFSEALEIDPEYVFSHVNWGRALSALGRYEEAIAKYSAALEIDPEFDYAYNNWGNALSALGRYEEAIAKYSAALEIDPAQEHAYYNWVDIMTQLLEGASLNLCARFEPLFPPIEQFTNTVQRETLFIDLFGETREACTRPSAIEISELEEIKLDALVTLPIEKPTLISPDGKWIKIVSDVPQDTTVTIKLISQDGDPFMQVFDATHLLVAENDDDPNSVESLNSKVTLNVRQGAYLLRVRTLESFESSASVNIEFVGVPITRDE
ncbi:TPR repeat-containing protein YrrB [Roseovarius albus]|uniref:TPR repeat-containing protein YrrB n=1 Tax=Roseovarius albus TaxID=1247867 RepID=A0A1X6YAM5_9RHOB|nr:tetratricopeptide repeat protein [Roseovarius albus]SLN15635.1 TPR repeat-containing protein YrrB [Roseovarius albus]